MKKRILQFRMTAKSVMIALLIGLSGMMKGYSQVTIGDLRYELNNTTLTATVTGHKNGSYASGTLDIPSSVIYTDYYGVTRTYSVTEIGSNAFSGYTYLTGCPNIPNSVTTINDRAFYGCSRITNFSIPSSVTTIGGGVFENTSWYNAQSDGILYLDNWALACKNYSPSGTLSIQEGTKGLAGWIFYNCQSLSTINTPNSLLYIGPMAFYNCRNLSSVGELCSVIVLGYCAFEDCSNLSSISIPSVNIIEEETFKNCTTLSSIVFSNTLTSIKRESFFGCLSLSVFSIPNSVTWIGSQAFGNCGFASVTIPNSVTSMGANPFSFCNNLETLIVEAANEVYDSRDNCCAIIYKQNNVLVSGCKNTEIPNSVTHIGEYAFSGCSGLHTITLNNSIVYIGSSAFQSCENLSTIIVLNSTPPSLGVGSFSLSFNDKIYVPYESLSNYKTAWSNYSSKIYPMTNITIPGYGESEGDYRFIASPLVENTTPTTVNDMITETPYDLYQFNQSATDGEWQNYKANSFNLVNGQGYLYVNAEYVNLIFKGNFNEDDTKEVSLAYDANAEFAGWNLVGNPFPVSAYANRSYYVMNEEGTAIEPVAISMEMAIPACTGVMVKAENTGETVTFSKTAPGEGANQGVLQIAVTQNNTRGNAIQDKAIVSFSSGDRLEKYIFNKDNAQLYIPQGGKDYAIACIGNESEMPLNFKAVKNGQYTICVNLEAVGMGYLHLLDNLTGANVDLLATPNYTFEAKTNDYASRFRLVFSSVCEDTDADNDFAFFSNGSFVINNEGQATLQVVDVTGRIIKSETINGCGNVNIDAATGVYMLRLVNGENVKVQKLVVR